MLKVEPLSMVPLEELLEQPGVIGSWIMVQESVLLLVGEVQIEPRSREPGWTGRRVELQVLTIVPKAKFLLILVVGVKRGESFPITHIYIWGHNHGH